MNIHEDILSKLTDEQKRKIESARTPEELLSLAKEAGYELSPEQLNGIAGGIDTSWCNLTCGDDCKKDDCRLWGR